MAAMVKVARGRGPADVKRAGREVCRIALAGCVPDETSARKILAMKARTS